jgi:hypothetical protein
MAKGHGGVKLLASWHLRNKKSKREKFWGQDTLFKAMPLLTSFN